MTAQIAQRQRHSLLPREINQRIRNIFAFKLYDLGAEIFGKTDVLM